VAFGGDGANSNYAKNWPSWSNIRELPTSTLSGLTGSYHSLYFWYRPCRFKTSLPYDFVDTATDMYKEKPKRRKQGENGVSQLSTVRSNWMTWIGHIPSTLPGKKLPDDL
jgi:hypothetical protein